MSHHYNISGTIRLRRLTRLPRVGRTKQHTRVLFFLRTCGAPNSALAFVLFFSCTIVFCCFFKRNRTLLCVFTRLWRVGRAKWRTHVCFFCDPGFFFTHLQRVGRAKQPTCVCFVFLRTRVFLFYLAHPRFWVFFTRLWHVRRAECTPAFVFFDFSFVWFFTPVAASWHLQYFKLLSYLILHLSVQ